MLEMQELLYCLRFCFPPFLGTRTVGQVLDTQFILRVLGGLLFHYFYIRFHDFLSDLMLNAQYRKRSLVLY